MAEALSTIYDAVPYHSNARTVSHPDRLACIGRLLGMDTPSPNACRVLELGAGDGGNLIPMAMSLPGSEFVGIDLAPTAVARGAAAARSAGVSNVELRQGDIRDLGPELGDFDFVIAHGVYSWVPSDVRHALLRVIRERMRAAGLAFVSYNALPGDHIRGVVRQMMRMHTSGISDPTEKLEQARALLQMLARVPGEAGDVYRPLLQSEIGQAIQASDDLLFHDDLAEISQPFFFSDFMGAARAEGLQFGAEAVFHTMNINTLPQDIAELLGELSATDIIAKEQYLDFLTCRGFRQTVLCHAEVSVDRAIDLERMRQLRFVTGARRDTEDSDHRVVGFRHRNGSALRTDHPVAIAALDQLVAAAPLSVAFPELATLAKAANVADEEALANTLFQAFANGVLELRLFEPEINVSVSDRPVASAWARTRANTTKVPNLYHEIIDLDEPSQRLLPFCDGTRTVEEVALSASMDESAARKTLAELAKLALLVR